jgi:hypothetical protein
MERSVKTDPLRSPTVLFNGGVRSQSARAAWLVRVLLAGATGLARVQLASTASLGRFPVGHASAMGIGTASPCRGQSLPCRVVLAFILDEIEALLFSRKEREPSFYLDLFWPWLLSVLRGGIAYPRDFRSTAPEPGRAWILTLEPCSSPGTAKAIPPLFGIDVSTRETSYQLCLRCNARVVLLLALPHRKSDRGDLAGDRQLRPHSASCPHRSAAGSPDATVR